MYDDKLSQESTCGSQSNSAEPKIDDNARPPNTAQRNGGRTDQGRLHAMRDSVLIRGLLETLTQCGENARKLRRLEAGYRSDLRPKGVWGRLFFDRFWQCVLRLILLGHLEAQGLAPRRNASKNPTTAASLREGFMPVLVTGENPEDSSAISVAVEALEPDLFHRLVLIARYDRAVSRELFRYLGLLILMRDGGKKKLAGGIRLAAGLKALDEEEK